MVTDMNIPFVNSVTGKIKNKRDKKLIAAELESHILDKADFYREIGYDEESALKKATEEMGNPDDTALPLRALHSGATKKLWLVIIILFGLLSSVFWFFLSNNSMNYALPMQTHDIFLDWLSFFILAVNILFMLIGYRQKSKALTICSMALASQTIIFPLLFIPLLLIPNYNYALPGTPFTLFQPALYAPIKSIVSGFGEYTGSLMVDSYLSNKISNPVFVVSIIIYALIMLWGLIQLFMIFSQERMRRVKILKPVLVITQRCFIAFLAALFALMSAGTISALANRQAAIKRIDNEKQKITELILSESPESISQKIEDMGFSVISSDRATGIGQTTYFRSDSNNAVIVSTGLSGYSSVSNYDNFIVACGRTDTEKRADLVSDCRLTDTEKDIYRSFNNTTDLQEFLDTGLYKKSPLISHERNINKSENKVEDIISFSFCDSENITSGNRETLAPIEIRFHAVYDINGKKPDFSGYWLYWYSEI